MITYTLYAGVHIRFLVRYSGEHQEMVFGAHPTHNVVLINTIFPVYPGTQRCVFKQLTLRTSDLQKGDFFLVISV